MTDEEQILQRQREEDEQLQPRNEENRDQVRVEDVEDAIQKSGGLGRFQYISFTIIVCGMLSGAFFLYSLPYFEKEPALLCQSVAGGPYTSCEKETACDTAETVAFKPDESSVYTMNNWVGKMDLYCTSDAKIGFLGSSFLAGTFFGSFIVPRASDVVGRRPLFLFGLNLFMLVLVGSLFCEDLYFMYVLLFLGGLAETGRYYVAYIYAVEMMPQKYQDACGLYIFMAFGVVMTFIALNFWFVTKNWYVNVYIALVFCLGSLVFTLFWLPESPRFYYSRKRFDEARAVMKTISGTNNGDQGTSFVFKAENDEVIDDSDSNKHKLNTSEMNSSRASETLPREPIGKQRGFSMDMNAAELAEAKDELNLKGNFTELFRVKVYRRNLIIMMIVWSFSAFSFFLVPFYIATIPSNIFLMSTCTAVAEIIASVICLTVTHNMDKKKSLIVFCAMSCLGTIGVMLFQWLYTGDSEIPEAATYLILYVGVVTAFDLVYVIVADLFPTIFLGTAYGCCNILGRAIAVLSPEVARLEKPLPMLILAIFAAIATILPFGLIKVKKE